MGFAILLISIATPIRAQVKPSQSVPFPLQRYISKTNNLSGLHKTTATDPIHSLLGKIVKINAADTTWWLDKIDEQYISEGTLSDRYHTYYAYDDYGNSVIMLMERYNISDQTWENFERADMIYNSGNLLTEFTILTWDTILANWQKSTRISLSYTLHKDIAEEIYMIWDGVNWVRDERISVTYDNRNRMSSVTYQYWDAVSSGWINYYQLLISYNADDSEYYEIYQVWFLGTWFPMESYVEYKHNSFDRVDSTFSQYSNGYYWVRSNFATYSYEKDTLLRKVENENWDESTGIWFLSSRDLYSYTADTLSTGSTDAQTSKVSEILTQNWSGSWVDSYRWIYVYDANQNIFQEIYEAKDSGIWARGYIEEYHYTLTRPTDVPTPVEAPLTIPMQTKLYQNYPNPFNPSTTIEYELKQPLDVRLEVFDVAGRLVRTLVLSKQSQGRHSISFNANGLASGVYFYRLQAGELIQVRKMVLIK